MHKLVMKVLAMKTIKKSLITTSNLFDKVETEIKILQLLKHPSIIKLYDTFENQDYFVLVTDISEYGDLLKYVRKRRRLKEGLAKNMMV